jgi:hypothetical protein|tara:strand:+ start:157 stop:354 length:198 start_codon:yes stop_codon:yes gene_type:complete
MTPGTNCLKGSAWNTWQLAGLKWRSNNQTSDIDEQTNAAKDFAAIEPSLIGQNARYRAFMECSHK